MFHRRSDDKTVVISVGVIVEMVMKFCLKIGRKLVKVISPRVVINGVILVFATFHENSINKNLFRTAQNRDEIFSVFSIQTIGPWFPSTP